MSQEVEVIINTGIEPEPHAKTQSFNTPLVVVPPPPPPQQHEVKVTQNPGNPLPTGKRKKKRVKCHRPQMSKDSSWTNVYQDKARGDIQTPGENVFRNLSPMSLASEVRRASQWHEAAFHEMSLRLDATCIALRNEIAASMTLRKEAVDWRVQAERLASLSGIHGDLPPGETSRSLEERNRELEEEFCLLLIFESGLVTWCSKCLLVGVDPEPYANWNDTETTSLESQVVLILCERSQFSQSFTYLITGILSNTIQINY
ncbi:hypothetical protein ACFE04_002379 [Oxalis oulophora]